MLLFSNGMMLVRFCFTNPVVAVIFPMPDYQKKTSHYSQRGFDNKTQPKMAKQPAGNDQNKSSN